MCGKFTALASWREVVAFSQPLSDMAAGASPADRDGVAASGEDGGSNDGIVTYRVGGPLPVIVWDAV